MTPPGQRIRAVGSTDFVRSEDLIDALIANGTLRMTDLPIQARRRSFTAQAATRAPSSEHLDPPG